MTVRDEPVFTDLFWTVDEFIPESKAVYVWGTSVEERSAYSPQWERNAIANGVEFLKIVDQQIAKVQVEFRQRRSEIPLRSIKQLGALWSKFTRRVVYLDITGLAHNVWAPLIRSALMHVKELRVVYIEPDDYRFRANPIEGEIFDLSERISGVLPIPGFASLTVTGGDNSCFVPLVGFEGTRLSYIIEQVQPPGGKILPIVGVPGFLPHYPFQTYHGNQLPFRQTEAWKNVHFATANCPFSLFYRLSEISRKYPNDTLKIAPIGTKPHALGAILYYLAHPRQVEIIYDHPIRKAFRTEGTARLLVYYISLFM